jgi:hypothetical protein
MWGVWGHTEGVAREEASSAGLLAAQQAALAAEHAAQLAVAQDSLRGMRQEVNERWVSTPAACPVAAASAMCLRREWYVHNHARPLWPPPAVVPCHLRAVLWAPSLLLVLPLLPLLPHVLLCCLLPRSLCVASAPSTALHLLSFSLPAPRPLSRHSSCPILHLPACCSAPDICLFPILLHSTCCPIPGRPAGS